MFTFIVVLTSDVGDAVSGYGLMCTYDPLPKKSSFYRRVLAEWSNISTIRSRRPLSNATLGFRIEHVLSSKCSNLCFTESYHIGTVAAIYVNVLLEATDLLERI